MRVMLLVLAVALSGCMTSSSDSCFMFCGGDTDNSVNVEFNPWPIVIGIVVIGALIGVIIAATGGRGQQQQQQVVVQVNKDEPPRDDVIIRRR